jgi:putative intracellular protease/amidase
MRPNGKPGLRVGAALFEGFELLDIFGPLELFGLTEPPASIVMLAMSPGPIASSMGPQAVATETLGSADGLDALLVPGGVGTRRLVENPNFLQALREQAAKARFVASICTGSALLARAGLLDGRVATSNKLAFAWAAGQGPKTEWRRRARWVEDGNCFTSSGVSAGMDMSLALLERLVGRSEAQRAALRAEYRWNEDPNDDPFALT